MHHIYIYVDKKKKKKTTLDTNPLTCSEWLMMIKRNSEIPLWNLKRLHENGTRDKMIVRPLL